MTTSVYTSFNPKQYLQDYYTEEPDDEDRFSMRFVLDSLALLPSDSVVIELGGGPVLDTVAAVCGQERVREVHFCDYVPENLDEVRRWLNKEPDAFNWDRYIAFVLQHEGKAGDPDEVSKRARAMRHKITQVFECDVRQSDPLPHQPNRAYDLAIAQTVTETAATTVNEWLVVIQNISTLVVPGGWLLISVVTGTSGYYVGQKLFPCLNLTDDDIQQGYREAGYELETLRIDKMPALGDRDYAGITNVIARKK